MLFAFMDILQEIKINHGKWNSGCGHKPRPTSDDNLRREESSRRNLANRLISSGVDRDEAYRRCGLS